MAKTATLAATAADAVPAGKKKKSKLMLALVLLLVLGGAGGGAAWWFVGRAHEAEAKPAAIKPPVFHTLEPFTVNLAEENGDHYLQLSVVYQVADDKAVDHVKVYLPVIRNRILLLLSAKRPSELQTAEGKQSERQRIAIAVDEHGVVSGMVTFEDLVEELVGAARASIPGTDPDRGITGAFLGAFVIQ